MVLVGMMTICEDLDAMKGQVGVEDLVDVVDVDVVVVEDVEVNLEGKGNHAHFLQLEGEH